MFETAVLSIAAAGMIALSGARFAAAGISSSRTMRRAQGRRGRDLKSLRQAAEIARLNSELQSTSGNAMQWRVLEVAETVDESSDCRSFYLVDPYRQSLPEFLPGQYLMVRPALAGAYQTTRCYSLSSSPDPRYWRITVKRQAEAAAPPGKRDGGLSAWLHDTIGAGDCLLIGGPSGKFFLPSDNRRPLVLLAAGIGITPMISMLRWSLEHTPERPVTLFYQVKDTQHWPFGPTLHRWQETARHVEIQSFLSRSDTEEIDQLQQGFHGKFSGGKFDSDHLLELSYAKQADYYMCGPDAWMTSLRNGLMESGIDYKRLHWESFGSAVGAQPSDKTRASGAVAVRFHDSDIEAEWSDPEQTLWELARENHIEIPSGCLSGVCGCCRVKLLRGAVEYDRTISIELAEDECLTCVARPTTHVAIDV